MATAALIDLSNYDTLLSQSSASRSGSPDGNIFFDVANGRIELITVEELATVALYNGVKATQTLTSTGVFADTETVTIGSKVYTFQTTLTNVDGNVLIGADQTASHLNLLNAMNLTGTPGTDYALAMTLHPTVDGTSSDGTTTVVTSKVQGTASNSIATTETVANATWGNTTLLGGTEPTAEANPLTEDLGIKLEALYAFERQERRIDETLRQYDFFFKGTFKFGGAYELVNGRKFDDADGSATSLTTDDRFKIRSSGWIERDTAGAVGRIYYGVKSLGAILASSQPYYQLSDGGAPVDFDKDGPIDESIQVYGDATIDTDTTTFDTRTFLSNKVRTFGQNYDEKQLADSGVSEMDGYFSGFALGESVHLTTGSYALADVYGGAQIAPWTGMTLEKLAVAQTETGFNEADGDFTWILHNTGSGTLDECVAFLDALAQTDDDIDSGAVTVTNGKRVGVWYTYNATGQIVTQSGADSLGLFIESIPTADEQSIVFTDDAGATKTRPFVVSVEVFVGSVAVADVLAWYHAFFLDGPGGNDFNTATALTVEDTGAVEVKGNVAVDAVANKIVFAFDYDGDTIGGTAATDKDVVFECEGDGGATAAKTVFTITRQTTVAATCEPSLETNV